MKHKLLSPKTPTNTSRSYLSYVIIGSLLTMVVHTILFLHSAGSDAYDNPTRRRANHDNAASIRLPINDPLERVTDAKERSVKQAAMVKEAMLSAWGAYKRYAWGHDELKPVSKTHHDWGGKNAKGMALTAVDSLSTLWLMGLHEEFDDAVKLVTEEVDYDQNIQVSVFEYTIRVVGGLLSAYELSGETNPRLLSTAQRMMDKLLVAYNTTTGMPHQIADLKTGAHWGVTWSRYASILSEFSVQLELRTLSYHTKDPKYDIRATHMTDITESQCKVSKGLCPIMFDFSSATPLSKEFSLGANSDSYYEYLLKQYLLTGRSEPRYERLALEALDEAIKKLLMVSPNSDAYFDYVRWAGLDSMSSHNTMEHLACFAGGMYALAADTFPNYKNANIYRKVAEDVTRTCSLMYETQLTGLSPERVVFLSDGTYNVTGNRNYLRPEAVESMFYQWRYTKDQKYRDWAWEIFLSFNKYSKVTKSGGYSGMILDAMPPAADDMMQSFFLAETLKYLYLIFAEDDVLDLNAWVFNTEAHPFRIRERDPKAIWQDWEAAHDGQPAYMPPTIRHLKVRTETKAMTDARIKSNGIKALVDPLALDKAPGS